MKRWAASYAATAALLLLIACKHSTAFEAPRHDQKAADVPAAAVSANGTAAGFDRDPAYHPFDAYSPWNTPIGDGAIYEKETSPGWDAELGANLNYKNWTHPISVAADSDPVRDLFKKNALFWRMKVSNDVQPDAKSDGNIHFIDEHHTYVVETYSAVRKDDGNLTVGGYARNYIDGPGVYDTWHGSRAYGGTAIGGVIRPGEFEKGIPHAIASAVHATALNKHGPNGKPYTWPAASQDAIWNEPLPTGYSDTGNVYMGSLLAIPRSVNIGDIQVNGRALSAKGRHFAQALQQFGTYIVAIGGNLNADGKGKIIFPSDPAAQGEVSPGLLREIDEIAKYLQVVTNNSEQHPGGPGERIGERPKQLPTSTLYHWDFLNDQTPGWVNSGGISHEAEQLRVNGTALAIYEKRDFSGSYCYQVEMTSGALTEANKAHIVFHFQNRNNYYFLEASGGSTGQVSLNKKENGIITPLGSMSYDVQNSTVLLEIAYDKKGRISATASKNGTVTTLFDGVPERSFKSGKIGLGGDNAAVTFDEVRIYRINQWPAAPTFRSTSELLDSLRRGNKLNDELYRKLSDNLYQAERFRQDGMPDKALEQLDAFMQLLDNSESASAMDPDAKTNLFDRADALKEQFNNDASAARPLPSEASEYSIDFSGGEAPDWSMNAACYVNDKENLFCESYGGGTSLAVYDGQIWSGDYVYQADVWTLSKGNGNRQRLYFNYTDENNSYYLDIGATANNDVFLRKKVNGKISDMGKYSGHYPLTGEKVTFEIEYLNGGTITVKGTAMDGTTTTLFDQVADTTFTGGKIGVGLWSSGAYFDNVIVKPLHRKPGDVR
ncbi:hypothetical protein PAESOLCIP111_01253 [Paenibacillus solanacearum]|uniref:FIMAH domain-containing protein n=1 Tax=Paenibacillus solanacearum TaxID=2048548 RepID=A0A916JWM0_9BACL|nr:hypothetical protein [Paenibacillus solanacearum]CAG7610536.1 hypothetical protein PAESOLCIP111_01253 [Paenibacillus solanacearum]